MGKENINFDSLVNLFKEHYKSNAAKLKRPIAGKSWSIQQSFVNVALILDKEKQKSEDEAQLKSADWHDLYVNQAEKIYESKKIIQYQQLFRSLPKDPQESLQKIFLVGAAGAGKTSLGQRIAYESSQEIVLEDSIRLPENIKLVVWVKLRELSAYLNLDDLVGKNLTERKKEEIKEKRQPYDGDGNLDLSKTFFGYLCSNFYGAGRFVGVSAKDMLKAFQGQQHSILYLIDGYDEIANLPLNKSVQEVFRNYFLKQPCVFVTSRPHYELPHATEFQKIELLGFPKEDMLKYVDFHFKENVDHPGSSALKTLLIGNNALCELAHIPVNLEILCVIMSGSGELPDLEKESTATLYQKMVFELVKRVDEKKKVLSKELISDSQTRDLDDIFNVAKKRGFFPVLGALALKGIQEGRTQFSYEEVKTTLPAHLSEAENKTNLLFLKDLIHLGFMKSFTWNKESNKFSGQGEFLHLTLQEFFAAWYFVEQWGSIWKDINNEEYNLKQAQLFKELHQTVHHYKYATSFSKIWLFVVGLLNQEKNEIFLDRFVELVESPPLELRSQYHESLVFRCLEELLPGFLPLKWRGYVERIKNNVYEQKPDFWEREKNFTSALNSPRWSKMLGETLVAWWLEDQNNRSLEFLGRIICIGCIGATSLLLDILTIMLEGDNPEIRGGACKAISTLRRPVATPRIFSALTTMLKDEANMWSRGVACEAVEALGSATPEIVRMIVDFSYSRRDIFGESNDSPLLDAAGNARSVLAVVSTSETLKVLEELLGDENPVIRASACHAMSDFKGSEVSKLIKRLENLLKDPNANVRKEACQSLQLFQLKLTPQILDSLMALLNDECDDVCISACNWLKALGTQAAEPRIIDILKTWFNNENRYIRSLAYWTLCDWGISSETLPRLDPIVFASDENSFRFSEPMPGTVGALERLLCREKDSEAFLFWLKRENKNVKIKLSACQTFFRLDPSSTNSEFLLTLKSFLNDPNWNIRRSACKIIEKLTPSVIHSKCGIFLEFLKQPYKSNELKFSFMLHKKEEADDYFIDVLDIHGNIIPQASFQVFLQDVKEIITIANEVQKDIRLPLSIELFEKKSPFTVPSPQPANGAPYPIINNPANVTVYVTNPLGNLFGPTEQVHIRDINISTHYNLGDPKMNNEKLPFTSVLQFLAWEEGHVNANEKAATHAFRARLFEFFASDPNSRYMDEVIGLALTEDSNQYNNLLREYVTFLENNPMIESHHWQGLASILCLGQGKKIISANTLLQMFAVLKNKSILFQKDGLMTVERLAILHVWRQLLEGMLISKVKLKKDFKKELTAVIKAHKQFFKDDPFDKETGENAVNWVSQILLRFKVDGQLPAGLESGLCLVSAAGHLADAAGLAATGLATPFFIGTVGSLVPVLSAVKDVGMAGFTLAKAAKQETIDKKNWFELTYYIKTQLSYQTACAAGWLVPHEKKDEEAKGLHTLLAEIKAIKHSSFRRHVAHGVIDTLLQLSQHLKGEDYSYIQDVYFQLLTFLFNEETGSLLRAQLLETLVTISELTEEYSGMLFCATLIKTNPAILVAMTMTPTLKQAFFGLYCWLEMKVRVSEKVAEKEDLQSQQKALLKISKASFPGQTLASQQAILEFLCLLQVCELIQIKQPIEVVLAELSAQHAQEGNIKQAQLHLQQLAQARQSLKRYQQSSTIEPSLLAVSWNLLDEKHQNVLEAGDNERAIERRARSKVGNAQNSPALFGHIGEVFFGIIRIGGVVISMDNKQESEALSDFMNATGASEIFLRKMEDAIDGKVNAESQCNPNVRLAESSDFVFVGAYCKGGIVFNRDKTAEQALRETVALARERLNKREASQIPILSVPVLGEASPLDILPPKEHAFLLKGCLPDTNEIIYFTEEKVLADGDCGFTTLGVTREQLVNVLLPMANKYNDRNKLSQEIQEAFMTGQLDPLPDEWTTLHQAYLTQQGAMDNQLRDLREVHPALREFSSKLSGEQIRAESMKWLDAQGFSEEAQTLRDAELDLFNAEEALKYYCRQIPTFELYCEAYRKNLWLGCHSALLYARQQGMAVYIWQRPKDKSNSLELRDHHCPESHSGQIIHMLFTGGGTHFNLLVKGNVLSPRRGGPGMFDSSIPGNNIISIPSSNAPTFGSNLGNE